MSNPGTSVVSAIAEALAESKKADGSPRRRTLSWARKVAREHYGITRMGEVRWTRILSAGLKAGVFELQDERWLALTVESPNVVLHEEEVMPEPELVRCGPALLECGHWNWGGDHEAAHALGKCCPLWKDPPAYEHTHKLDLARLLRKDTP